MRRISVLVTACVVAVALLALSPVMASAAPPKATDLVVHVHNGPLATVTLAVNAGTPQNATLTADSKGDCTLYGSWPKGSVATVTATLGSATSTATKTLEPNHNTVNIQLATAVPEFGAIAAGAAVLISVVGFILIRRRRLVAGH